jgi:hypothetical protein
MTNVNRDVVYIQKDNGLPYITFGSKLAWNVGKAWVLSENNHRLVRMVDQVEKDNIVCIYRHDAFKMVEFIERVGIVGIEWTNSLFFFSSEDFKEWIK